MREGRSRAAGDTRTRSYRDTVQNSLILVGRASRAHAVFAFHLLELDIPAKCTESTSFGPTVARRSAPSHLPGLDFKESSDNFKDFRCVLQP